MISYDILGRDKQEDSWDVYSFGKLLEVFDQKPYAQVKFVDTQFTIGEVISWRGSHDQPAIIYEEGFRTAKECAEIIRKGLAKKHQGYKGGEYSYREESVPFLVSSADIFEEYKIVGCSYNLMSNSVVLMTKIVPW